MEILIVAADRLLALSLEAAIDLGGHQTLGTAATANVAVSLVQANRPAFALIHLGSLGSQGLARKLRDRFDVPSLLVAPPGSHCAAADRAAAWGQISAPCGSRTYLKAIAIAAGLRGGAPSARSAAAAHRAVPPWRASTRRHHGIAQHGDSRGQSGLNETGHPGVSAQLIERYANHP